MVTSKATARKVKKLGIIGCGLRADCYLYQLADEIGQSIQLSAIADTRLEAIKSCINLHAKGTEVKVFLSSGREMIDMCGHELDAVIISSPNAFHVESALPALEKGLSILLEKPVATSVEDCAKLWQAYVKADYPAVLIGFVLR